MVTLKRNQVNHNVKVSSVDHSDVNVVFTTNLGVSMIKGTCFFDAHT